MRYEGGQLTLKQATAYELEGRPGKPKPKGFRRGVADGKARRGGGPIGLGPPPPGLSPDRVSQQPQVHGVPSLPQVQPQGQSGSI